jgi:hypothetical protein
MRDERDVPGADIRAKDIATVALVVYSHCELLRGVGQERRGSKDVYYKQTDRSASVGISRR